MKQANRNTLSGFSTGTGLSLWLFFLFCFIFLGYPVPLSILLSAVGGLASALVFGWWKTKDNPDDLRPMILEDQENFEEASPRVSGLRLAHQRNVKARNRSQVSLNPFRRFFPRDRSSNR